MKKTQIVFNTLTVLLTIFALAISFNVPRKFGYVLRHSTPSNRAYKNMNSLLIKQPVTEEKSFVVVITSYNNEKICERNLLSVFNQTYQNYRVIYIDDCSEDGTYEKVQAFIKRMDQEKRVTLIRNPERKLKLANLYPAYTSCKDSEIIVCLDGDDWLAHDNVLEELNHYYQNPNVWISYGSAINHPKYDKKDGCSITDDVLIKNQIRKKRFYISMLRSFYAGLFKKIKLKDLLYQGKFFASADDFAFMIPMIEMAPMHTLFIPEVLYIINDTNPIRESAIIPILQQKLKKYIQTKEPYACLDSNFDPRCVESSPLKESFDLIVLSEMGPKTTAESLKNYLSNVSPIDNIYVLFKAATPDEELAYQKLMQEFPTVSFIHETTISLKSLVERSSSYIGIATDNLILTSPINPIDCINGLKLTGAINFFVGPTAPQLNILTINNNLVANTFESILKTPNFLTNELFSIFEKKFLLETLSSEKPFLNSVYIKDKNLSEVTLFYSKPKALPINNF